MWWNSRFTANLSLTCFNFPVGFEAIQKRWFPITPIFMWRVEHCFFSWSDCSSSLKWTLCLCTLTSFYLFFPVLSERQMQVFRMSRRLLNLSRRVSYKLFWLSSVALGERIKGFEPDSTWPILTRIKTISECWFRIKLNALRLLALIFIYPLIHFLNSVVEEAEVG